MVTITAGSGSILWLQSWVRQEKQDQSVMHLQQAHSKNTLVWDCGELNKKIEQRDTTRSAVEKVVFSSELNCLFWNFSNLLNKRLNQIFEFQRSIGGRCHVHVIELFFVFYDNPYILWKDQKTKKIYRKKKKLLKNRETFQHQRGFKFPIENQPENCIYQLISIKILFG